MRKDASAIACALKVKFCHIHRGVQQFVSLSASSFPVAKVYVFVGILPGAHLSTDTTRFIIKRLRQDKGPPTLVSAQAWKEQDLLF